MSYENPTRLQIGMHGDFAGKDFRLIGRVVMGVDVDGETYYWNEFNLQTKDGENATLVYEETERGGEWRLFTMFEPEYAMTAADAVTKQVGDPLNLNGTDVRVTLVSSARLYRIEGLPPEDVKVGDVSNYFNAEAGDTMIVVDWTGKEVEFYQGLNLSHGAVEAAFNLPRATQPGGLNRFARLDSAGATDYTGTLKFILQAAVVVGLFLLIFGRGLFSGALTREAAPAKRFSAAAPPLVIGAEGRWQETKFHITAHAVVEIAEPGVVFDRHEYTLADDFGLPSLLVCGDTPGATDWTLYSPLAPLLPPTPQQSAAKKSGDTVNVDGVVATVTDLFQSTVRSVDTVETNSVHAGEVSFGFLGRSEYNSLLVRWDKASIHFYRGKKVSPKEFSAAFSAGSGK